MQNRKRAAQSAIIDGAKNLLRSSEFFHGKARVLSRSH